MNAMTQFQEPAEAMTDPSVEFGPINIKLRDGIKPSDAAGVIASATEFMVAAKNYGKSAVHMCVAMYRCHRAYQSLGDDGWEQFAAENFGPLGMSPQKIARAIRAGEIAEASWGGSTGMPNIFGKLSKAALLSLADASEQTVEAHKVIIENNPSSNVEDIKSRAVYLASREGEFAELTAKVEALNKRRIALEETNAAINQQLMEAEKDSETLRNELMGQNSSESRRTQDGSESLDAVNAELVQLTTQRDELVAEMTKLRAKREGQADEFQKKINAIERRHKDLAAAETTIEQMQADVKALLAKYTMPLIKSVTDTNDMTRALIGSIAADLHELADQITPQ
jgi:hypothetical protein